MCFFFKQELTDADMTMEEKADYINAVNHVIHHTKEWSHIRPFDLKKIKKTNHPYEHGTVKYDVGGPNQQQQQQQQQQHNNDGVSNNTNNNSFGDASIDQQDVSLLRRDNAIVLQRLRTRMMGPYIMVDVDIEVPPRISASAAHQVAEHIRKAVVLSDRRVNEVNVHVDPRAAQHFRRRSWKVESQVHRNTGMKSQGGDGDRDYSKKKLSETGSQDLKYDDDGDNNSHGVVEYHDGSTNNSDDHDDTNQPPATDDVVLPLLPMPHIVEESIRQAIKKIPSIITKYDVHISEVQCYYEQDKLHVKMDILLPPHKSINEADRGILFVKKLN
jgi:hypothetical protein